MGKNELDFLVNDETKTNFEKALLNVLRDTLIKNRGYGTFGHKHQHCSCDMGKKYYQYKGDELVTISREGVTEIYWNDGTKTITVHHENDSNEKDLKLGVMICVVKKFCSSVSIDKLYDYTNGNTKALKYILECIIRGSAGNRAYNDIEKIVNSYKEKFKKEDELKNRKIKSAKRKQSFLKRIQELKNKGKYHSKAEKEKMHQERLRLEALKQEKYDYDEDKKEVERLKRELGMK